LQAIFSGDTFRFGLQHPEIETCQMNQNTRLFSILILAIAALGGCSSQPSDSEAKKPEIPLQKVQGKVRVVPDQTASGDGSLNAGGPSLYLWKGKRFYRLFPKRGLTLVDGADYIVEGVNAQKVIDEIGDPDQGKKGYPLLSSCARVVKMAWGGLSFEESDLKAGVLRTRVARYPARAVLLVVRIEPATSKDGAKKEAAGEEKDLPTVAVAAAKQSGSLIAGSLVQPAPLWEPAGGPVRCKVVIDREGKVSELETGAQLCENFNWDQLRYKPLAQGGHPVQVRTEVEVRFKPRK
jgi:hypothetical protein